MSGVAVVSGCRTSSDAAAVLGDVARLAGVGLGSLIRVLRPRPAREGVELAPHERVLLIGAMMAHALELETRPWPILIRRGRTIVLALPLPGPSSSWWPAPENREAARRAIEKLLGGVVA